jgi:transposase
MIYLSISEDEAKKIEEERFNCADPIISRRLHALYLKYQGCPHQEISQYVGLSSNALTSVFKKYASSGLEGVKSVKYHPKHSELEEHRELLKAHFEQHPPASVKQACRDIEKLTGIKKKEERVRIFLHQMGMKPRKVGGMPANANPDRQEEFKKKALSRSYKRHWKVKLLSILLMPLISCWVLFYLFYGLFRGFLSRPRLEESD